MISVRRPKQQEGGVTIERPNEYVVERPNEYTPRPRSEKWQCHMWGGRNDIIYVPLKGEEPNAFWRWMQYLCFGHRWKKM